MTLFKGCKDGVHKFKPRYDLVAPEWMNRLSHWKRGNPKEMYEKVYVHDICVRCGAVAKKGDSDDR